MAVEHFLVAKRMETQIADVSLVSVFGSTAYEPGHTFDPYVMLQIIALLLGALEKEQVDVVTTITIFTDIDGYKALVVTLAQNVVTNIRIQRLKTWNVSNLEGKVSR